MAAVWSDEARYQRWLEVELGLLLAEANCQLGRIPPGAMRRTSEARAVFQVERILHIEARVRHDVIAFLTNLNEQVGDAGRYIHMGMTSSDVLDTAMGAANEGGGGAAAARTGSTGDRRPPTGAAPQGHGHGRPLPRHPRGTHHPGIQVGRLAGGGAAPPGSAWFGWSRWWPWVRSAGPWAPTPMLIPGWKPWFAPGWASSPTPSAPR